MKTRKEARTRGANVPAGPRPQPPAVSEYEVPLCDCNHCAFAKIHLQNVRIGEFSSISRFCAFLILMKYLYICTHLSMHVPIDDDGVCSCVRVCVGTYHSTMAMPACS
jgi:hypothetical protein